MEITGYPQADNEVRLSITHDIMKISSKWLKGLNMRAKTLRRTHRFLRRTQINLCVFGLGNSFLDLTPKAPAIK